MRIAGVQGFFPIVIIPEDEAMVMAKEKLRDERFTKCKGTDTIVITFDLSTGESSEKLKIV